jgi:crotonobetainyl-CoA:carnitine CoA-transferase CaiB-like acyl-CoA transferase
VLAPGSVLSAGGLALPEMSDAVLGVDVTGSDPVLPTAFPIGEAAATALAAGGAAAVRLHRLRGGAAQSVTVDVDAAAASLLGFLFQSQPDGGEPLQLTRLNPPDTNFFQCRDGRWIHLHGGFPHLSEGTLELLGCTADREVIAAAVRRWTAPDLEDALAERRLCGAMLRTAGEWADHPQGAALGTLAAMEIDRIGDAPPHGWALGDRPLSDIRVLDLTRVLAGPAAGRTLASYGADVLRIAAPHLPAIQPFVVETGHGKRSAFLDLRDADQARRLRELAHDADVFVDGYRNGSLARYGFDAETLAELRPGIVVVSISCYGDVGPWAQRAGWEQLAQTASGLAHAHSGDGPPRLVPAAATDYTTGYLAAWGAMEALHRRATEGGSWRVRVSLCQTAQWLLRLGARCDPTAHTGLGDVGRLQITSETPYGRLRHLAPAVRLSATPPRWEQPTVPLGHDPPEWRPRALPPDRPTAARQAPSGSSVESSARGGRNA